MPNINYEQIQGIFQWLGKKDYLSDRWDLIHREYLKSIKYGLDDVKNLESVYIIRGKAVYVTMSGKLVPPNDGNRVWHWDVKMVPYQGDDVADVLKRRFPNTPVILDSSKKYQNQRSLFKEAAEELVNSLFPKPDFASIEFPVIKNVQAATIADSIKGVQPSLESPPIKRKYQDHMGNQVTEFESGGTTTHCYSSTHLYGDYGHAFGMGYFIVNESGEMIFASRDPEQYNTLSEKCRPFWKILKGLQERFPGYRVGMSRGERLAVNDKIMKGFLFYPGMLRLREGMDVEAEIQKEIEFVANEIQLDIDRGRIVKGEYGAE
jgi:hypothetical protein